MKLEGGLSDEWSSTQQAVRGSSQHPCVVIYSGALEEVSGVHLLLDAFGLIAKPGFELWITGKGRLAPQVREAAGVDSRIRYLGYLEREAYRATLGSATVLVNPRLSKYPESRYNFPSKILEYMASGIPVITTATGDLVKEYGDKAFILWEETPMALASLIEEVCGMSPDYLRSCGEKARDYVLARKTWGTQAARVYDFLNRLAGTTKREKANQKCAGG